jgi:hypothetical protein
MTHLLLYSIWHASISFFFFFFLFFSFHSLQLDIYLMSFCRTNSSSKERKRKRARERENDRLTGSMLVVVYSCHGYWSMRIDGTTYTRKKNIRAKNLFVFSSLPSIFLPLTLIGATAAIITALLS